MSIPGNLERHLIGLLDAKNYSSFSSSSCGHRLDSRLLFEPSHRRIILKL